MNELLRLLLSLSLSASLVMALIFAAYKLRRLMNRAFAIEKNCHNGPIKEPVL